MTPDLYVSEAKDWTRLLEDYAAQSMRASVTDARKRVARDLGISAGTLENLRNRSPKAVAAHVYARLRAGVVRQLERELTRVEHELQVARQSGEDPAGGVVLSALSSRARLREALGLTVGGEA